MNHIACDAEGFVVAIHKGLAVNPLDAPVGGSTSTVPANFVQQIELAWGKGKRARLNGGTLSEEEPPKPAPTQASAATLRDARRKKMRLISDTSVGSRNRRFDAYPHVPAASHDWGRLMGPLWLLVLGAKKLDDTVTTRNLRTGHYEKITLAELGQEIVGMVAVHELLREVDQSYRDQIDAIYNDPAKSPEQKLAELEAFSVPEFLGVDAKTTATELRFKTDLTSSAKNES